MRVGSPKKISPFVWGRGEAGVRDAPRSDTDEKILMR